MSNRTIGLVGGGRITRIFPEGWRRANASPANIRVAWDLPEDQTVGCDL
jgi:hypothetical protein